MLLLLPPFGGMGAGGGGGRFCSVLCLHHTDRLIALLYKEGR
jgi:hypothetical protein